MTTTITRLLLAAGYLAIWPASPRAAAASLEPGTISIEASSTQPVAGYSADTFVDAVSDMLTKRAFILLEGRGHARLVAEISLSQVDVGTANTKVPPPEALKFVQGGVAAVGGSVTVQLPSAKLQVVSIVQSRLEVRIKKLGEDNVVWDGAALTVRPTSSADGQEKVVAADLVEAIFRDFPTEPEDVITVP